VPGGWFLHAFGQSDLESWTGRWIAGFTIERDELVTFTEPEGSATFQWILAHS
jgi:hypothetical protein